MVPVRIGRKGKPMTHLHTVIQVVSPSRFGGETKNQDRCLFDVETHTACVCDGTTASPYAAQAAKYVSQCVPILLDNPKPNLEIIADYLVARRNMVMKKGIKAHESVPVSIRNSVQDAAKRSLAQSFQTTLVAAGFERQQTCIVTRVLSCGDSGFWAFSPSGEQLLTNLQDTQTKSNPGQHQDFNTIHYYPGCELLVKLKGTLRDFPTFVKNSEQRCPDKWYVCEVICPYGSQGATHDVKQGPRLCLKAGELLLAPKYLVSTPKDLEHPEFRRLHYSRFVCPVASLGAVHSNMHHDLLSNITTVLPDHYYTGQWTWFDERFPIGTHFLLCSDGFYRAFSDPAHMWTWLKTNEDDLRKKHTKHMLISRLHDQLNQTCGDDDISLIWMIPTKGKDKDAVGSNE